MSVSIPRFIGLCLIGSLLVACSESTEDDDSGPASSGAGAGSSSGPGAGAGGPGNGGSGPGSGGSGAGAAGGAGSGGAGSGGQPASVDVVINEISAAGDDFVELFNAGAAPFDLTGFGLCDTADDGMPKVAEATRFVDGETLAPGAFLVVVADLAAAPPGPQTDCLAGAVASCYHASWGISAGNGEKIFLLDTADAQVGVAEYGPDAVPEGQTLGHIPDGQGALVPNAPTPGAANTAP